MPATIIRPKQTGSSSIDSNTGDFEISDIPQGQVFLLTPLEVDMDLFGDFEDRIWGEVDGVYDVGDPPPS